MTYTISWPVTDDNGMTVFCQNTAPTLDEAEAWARAESRRHGDATVTDRTGLVSAFVGGQRWEPTAGAETS